MKEQATFEQRMQAQRRSGVRFWRIQAVILILVGLLMAAIAFSVFFSQDSQIEVTARVISKSCHYKYNVMVHQGEIRCDARVRFTAVNGQVIQTAITDAFPEEFSDSGSGETIDLRYAPGFPGQPLKQSNYMSVGQFIFVLSIGVGSLTLGCWMYAGAGWLQERMAARYEARRRALRADMRSSYRRKIVR